MNGRVARAAILAAVAALPAPALAGKPTEVPLATHRAQADKVAIRQLEHRWISDIGSGNRGDLATILADDYRDIDWQGHVRNKQALLASTTKASRTSQHIRELHVRVWGETAVATGTNEVHSATKGWTAGISFTDVFARIEGHWRAVASQETLRKSPTPGT